MAFRPDASSWADDAILDNRDSGIYADTAKIHSIDHSGEFANIAWPRVASK